MPDEDVRRLARRAISVLASMEPGRNEAVSRRLREFCDAFLSSDEELRHNTLQRIRQEGVTPSNIIDHIVPAAARLMGEMWFADEISFAHVTIGAARLQESVRSLAHRDRIHRSYRDTGSAILLVIPRVEQHTLGTFVLADQLRRLGYAVDVAIDQHPRQLAVTLRQRHYVMVGITVSGRRTLASTTELVDIIRSTVTRVTPIVIGGSVLSSDIDVKAISGADHTAKDAESALLKCGLEVAREGPLLSWNAESRG